MSAREWLLGELEDELRANPQPEQAAQPWFDAVLASALADIDMSDRAIELLIELADPALEGSTVSPAPLATDPSIASRREALGITTAEAARLLGISRTGYEAIEQAPLRWDTVTDTRKVTAFLARVGVRPAVFLRWLAAMRPSVAGHAWGYRPGAVLDRPVEVAPPDHEHFLSWGQRILGERPPASASADDEQLLGEVWSASSAADGAAAIFAAARARLLSTDLRSDAPKAPAAASVIALETDEGLAYPGFQFDHDGSLIPIVGEINETLGAANDPWGVADWWLGEDPSLGGRPVDLIVGSSDDQDRLRAAARSVLESD